MKLTCSLNWKSNLKFPPSYQVSKHCVDFMTKLLCEPEDRLGSVGRPSSRSRSASFLGSSRRGTNGTTGLESDGVEEIKAHTWFASIDWDCEYPALTLDPGHRFSIGIR